MVFFFWIVKFDLSHFIKYVYHFDVITICLTILKRKKVCIWQIASKRRKFCMENLKATYQVVDKKRLKIYELIILYLIVRISWHLTQVIFKVSYVSTWSFIILTLLVFMIMNKMLHKVSSGMIITLRFTLFA